MFTSPQLSIFIADLIGYLLNISKSQNRLLLRESSLSRVWSHVFHSLRFRAPSSPDPPRLPCPFVAHSPRPPRLPRPFASPMIYKRTTNRPQKEALRGRGPSAASPISGVVNLNADNLIGPSFFPSSFFSFFRSREIWKSLSHTRYLGSLIYIIAEYTADTFAAPLRC